MVKILVVGLATIFAVIVLKQYKPEFAMIVSLSGGIIIVFLIFEPLKQIIDSFFSIDAFSSITDQIIKPILKVMGIGYLTEFGANLAEDAGIKFLASKIYLAGKVLILFICLPIAISAITSILGLL